MWSRAEATIPALSVTAITGTSPYVQDRSSPEEMCTQVLARQVGRVSSDSALKASPLIVKVEPYCCQRKRFSMYGKQRRRP